jgi:PAS domain S-box-containing protein
VRSRVANDDSALAALVSSRPRYGLRDFLLIVSWLTLALLIVGGVWVYLPNLLIVSIAIMLGGTLLYLGQRHLLAQQHADATIASLNKQLTADLEGMTHLQELSTRMVGADNLSLLLDEILDAAIRITDADMGNVQLLGGEALRIVAQRGFEAPFLEFFATVHENQAACGSAMRHGSRVIVDDVASSAIFAGTPALQVLLDARVHAVQSTPLVSHSGRVLGMFSTHYHAPRRPSEPQLRMLDMLARLAADLIESKHAEEALRASEFALRETTEALQAKEVELDLVVSRTPLLLTRCSRDLRYLFANRACAEFYGRPVQEIIGRPIADIMGPVAFETIAPHVARVLRGETVQYETEIPYKGVGRRFMRAQYTPDRDGRGEVTGWLATMSDITETKRLEYERQQSASELAVAFVERTKAARHAEEAEQSVREADRRKDDFVATLAHELRNPLAPLRNALELLRRSQDDKGFFEGALSIMERQVGQMVRLVDDLLDVSRINKGKLQIRKERVELADVLNAALETARPSIEASVHRLTVTMPPEPVHVQADPTRLAQVFANLLNNAAKYTEKDGRIWLTAVHGYKEVIVAVRDTGIGIPAEHLPHVFTIFSQVASAVERSQGGLGIGLSLAKGLVELHGGTIEAQSAGPGKGSVFTVHLPAVGAPVEAPKEQGSDGERAPESRKRRILVVDDLRDSADSLAMMLRLLGHDIRTAYDGLEAVRTAEAFRPDVVLLDIGLPKLNGYETARRIRTEPWGSSIALVALTGWGQDQDKRRSAEAGFDHHLTKPVDPAVLRQLLAVVVPEH